MIRWGLLFYVYLLSRLGVKPKKKPAKKTAKKVTDGPTNTADENGVKLAPCPQCNL